MSLFPGGAQAWTKDEGMWVQFYQQILALRAGQVYGMCVKTIQEPDITFAIEQATRTLQALKAADIDHDEEEERTFD